MKTITQAESVSRSRFIDCPNCKTRTLKLKRVVQTGRCKSCHESYKIVIVYVKEGRTKPKSVAITTPAGSAASQGSTLPSWEMPSDNSLFGPQPKESDSTFSDSGSFFGEDKGDTKTPSNGQ